MPEQHGKQSRNAEHQRKREKVPLFPEKIYVGVFKKFHAMNTPVSMFQSSNETLVSRFQESPPELRPAKPVKPLNFEN
jgi:hypothetical protein